MSFHKLFGAGHKVLSFEFFPPKQSSSLAATKEQILSLASYRPDFMTVTYGAGGSTRSFTKDLAAFIETEAKVPAVAHLTCVGHAAHEIDGLLEELQSAGIRHILALRGDPPSGETKFVPCAGGFACARDLVRHIKTRLPDMSIAVAGYPEMHKEAVSPAGEIEYLKEKVDAGAELVVTQLFFDANYYFDFVERAIKAGVRVPIIPGIMPIGNVQQVQRFTSMCGASIPPGLAKALTDLQDRPGDVIPFGIEYATALCEGLLQGGAPGIHLYTLNKSTQVAPIVEALTQYFS